MASGFASFVKGLEEGAKTGTLLASRATYNRTLTGKERRAQEIADRAEKQRGVMAGLYDTPDGGIPMPGEPAPAEAAPTEAAPTEAAPTEAMPSGIGTEGAKKTEKAKPTEPVALQHRDWNKITGDMIRNLEDPSPENVQRVHRQVAQVQQRGFLKHLTDAQAPLEAGDYAGAATKLQQAYGFMDSGVQMDAIPMQNGVLLQRKSEETGERVGKPIMVTAKNLPGFRNQFVGENGLMTFGMWTQADANELMKIELQKEANTISSRRAKTAERAQTFKEEKEYPLQLATHRTNERRLLADINYRKQFLEQGAWKARMDAITARMKAGQMTMADSNTLMKLADDWMTYDLEPDQGPGEDDDMFELRQREGKILGQRRDELRTKFVEMQKAMGDPNPPLYYSLAKGLVLNNYDFTVRTDPDTGQTSLVVYDPAKSTKDKLHEVDPSILLGRYGAAPKEARKAANPSNVWNTGGAIPPP